MSIEKRKTSHVTFMHFSNTSDEEFFARASWLANHLVKERESLENLTNTAENSPNPYCSSFDDKAFKKSRH